MSITLGWDGMDSFMQVSHSVLCPVWLFVFILVIMMLFESCMESGRGSPDRSETLRSTAKRTRLCVAFGTKGVAFLHGSILKPERLLINYTEYYTTTVPFRVAQWFALYG